MMKKKLNCWDYAKCGFEPGGEQAKLKGVCSAAVSQQTDSLNRGIGFGRICWGVAGTMCQERVTIRYKERLTGIRIEELCSCLTCEFFKMVKKEEGAKFKMILPVLHEDKKSSRKEQSV